MWTPPGTRRPPSGASCSTPGTMEDQQLFQTSVRPRMGSRPNSSASYFSQPPVPRKDSETPRTNLHRQYEDEDEFSTESGLYQSEENSSIHTETAGSTSYLHPSHRQPVKETHMAEIEHDPVTNMKSINSYQVIQEIGRGVHGRVKLGVNLLTGDQVAIKIVDRHARRRLGRPESANNQEAKIRREIAILKKCSHPNVVRLIEVIDDPTQNKVYLILEFVELGEVKWRKQPTDFEIVKREVQRLHREKLGLDDVPCNPEQSDARTKRAHNRRRRKTIGGTNNVMNEHCWSLELGGLTDEEESDFSSARGSEVEGDTDGEYDIDLRYDMSYIPSLTIEQARSIFRDTLLGLEYLHYQGIIHRDIKPANLLWTKNRRVKISDFGVSYLGVSPASVSKVDSDAIDLELAKTAGTPAFFAPELCCSDFTKPRARITAAIDIWALGVTLYCLIYARCPFLADGELELFKKIETEEVFIPKRRVRPEVETRPVTSSREGQYRRVPGPELLDMETEIVSPDLIDLLERLLTKDPAKRITIKEIKQHPWVTAGIVNPQLWMQETDPARLSDGRKIEVTREDVDGAVTVGVFGMVKGIIKRFVGTLRKRASSSANVGRRNLRDTEASSVRDSIRMTDESGDNASTIDGSEYRENPAGDAAETVSVFSAVSAVSGKSHDPEAQLSRVRTARGSCPPSATSSARQTAASFDGSAEETPKRPKSTLLATAHLAALRRQPSASHEHLNVPHRSSPVSPLAGSARSVMSNLDRSTTNITAVKTTTSSSSSLAQNISGLFGLKDATKQLVRSIRKRSDASKKLSKLGRHSNKSATEMPPVPPVPTEIAEPLTRTVSAVPPTLPAPVDINPSISLEFTGPKEDASPPVVLSQPEEPPALDNLDFPKLQTTQTSTSFSPSLDMTPNSPCEMPEAKSWSETPEAQRAQQREEIESLLGSIDKCPMSPTGLRPVSDVKEKIPPLPIAGSPLRHTHGKLSSSLSDEQLNNTNTPATTVSTTLSDNTSYPSVPSMLTASSSMSDHAAMGWTTARRPSDADEKVQPLSAVPLHARLGCRDADSGYCIAEEDSNPIHLSTVAGVSVPTPPIERDEDDDSDPEGFFINLGGKQKKDNGSITSERPLPPPPSFDRRGSTSRGRDSNGKRPRRKSRSSGTDGSRRAKKEAAQHAQTFEGGVGQISIQ